MPEFYAIEFNTKCKDMPDNTASVHVGLNIFSTYEKALKHAIDFSYRMACETSVIVLSYAIKSVSFWKGD